MLVIGLIVQIATVLLDGVDAKLGRIDGLGSQVVGLKITADHSMALRLGRGLGPEVLDLSALGDEVPFGVRLAGVLLGLRQGWEGVESVRDKEGDLVKDGLGLSGHGAEGSLVVLDLIGPRRGDILSFPCNAVEHMLSILLQVDGGGGANQQSRGGDPHDEGGGACDDEEKQDR